MGKAYGNKTAAEKRPAIRKGDNYSTHYSLTDLGLEAMKLDKNVEVLEPAAGSGAMADRLAEYFTRVTAIDPDKGFVIYDEGIKNNERKNLKGYDFRNFPFAAEFGYIITNPPYNLADEFVIRAKRMRPEKICFLLRTNFLSGAGRLAAGIFQGLSEVLIFNRMPDMRAPIREDGKFPTAMNVYAWFVWTLGYKGKPVIDWIDCQRFVLSEKDIDQDYKNKLVKLGIRKK